MMSSSKSSLHVTLASQIARSFGQSIPSALHWIGSLDLWAIVQRQLQQHGMVRCPLAQACVLEAGVCKIYLTGSAQSLFRLLLRRSLHSLRQIFVFCMGYLRVIDM